MSTSTYLVALNCGSSSIKGKLYRLGDKFTTVATISVSNIGSPGDNVKLQISWVDDGNDVKEEMGKGSEVEHRDVFPALLKHLSSSGSVKANEIKYLTHRIVHGGENTKGVVVTKEHSEALDQMDELSAFAPLHNHHAVLCVKACLDTLPESTNLLLFDTLFHQTLSPEVYTYALPPAETTIPLRKYGFHGLSYSSIVHSLAKDLGKSDGEINVVVAHLGSGASACCIQEGKSIDTSMGLTPLEGLVGGTRTGTIDPTAIFHHSPDYAEDAGIGMKVTKGEYIMNKKSGLAALAGTQNFGLISKDAMDPSSDNHEKAKLAYDVFLDRLMGFIAQYLFKLVERVGIEGVDGIVFSGGIGENADGLREEVMRRLGWLGVKAGEGRKLVKTVERISAGDSKIPIYVVKTDEEGWCAHIAREQLGI